MPALRIILLATIALDLALIAIRVLLYQPRLTMPGRPTFIIDPAFMLIVYAAAIVWTM